MTEPDMEMSPPTASPLRPDGWDVDVVLKSGRVARVRSINPDDADPLRDLHSRLSPETRLLRFFTPMPTLPDTLVERFVNVDQVDRVALVVELDEQLIAVGRYDRLGDKPEEAEVAFVVDDRFQGEGIGSLLLEHLAAIALEHGIERFVAETMASNESMLRVFGSAGFQVKRQLSGGIFDVSFAIEPTEKSEEVRERRDHRATVASIERLLRPRVVATLGASHLAQQHARMLASTFDGTMSSYAADSLIEPFRGRMLPPGELEVGVDLVVIDLPVEELGDAVARCAAHDAGVLLVMSQGFASLVGSDDSADDGTERSRQMARFARRHGMRVVGPNSLGVVNADPAIGLFLLSSGLDQSTASTVALGAGSIGVFAHSSRLSQEVLSALGERNLGVSGFVSAGDKTDVSGNDMLEYWENDERTDVIVLAVESFGNPRRFARLAERVGRRKPIIILAPDDPETEALCRRTGVVRADTVASMAQTASVFVLHPEWYQPPTVNQVLLPDMSPEAVDAAEAALAEVGVGVLRDDHLRAVLAVVGLDGWGGPADGSHVCGRQDPRFGPIVELHRPGLAASVSLAPLTNADVAGLTQGSSALHDVLLRVGAAMARLPDLAELRVELTRHDTPATVTAIAAPSPNGITQIVRRLT